MQYHILTARKYLVLNSQKLHYYVVCVLEQSIIILANVQYDNILFNTFLNLVSLELMSMCEHYCWHVHIFFIFTNFLAFNRPQGYTRVTRQFLAEKI